MNNLLQSKVVALTGSSGLLGQDIVKILLENGATVIGIDIAPSNLQAESYQEFQADTTDEHECNRLCDSLFEKYGIIHGWVNNAYPRTDDWGVKLEHIKVDSWRKNIEMQLNSYCMISTMVAERMKSRHICGSIVNMASIYGVVAPSFDVYEGSSMTMPAAYSAIKGGVIMFTKYIASYYGPHGIRCNSVAPGGIYNGQPESFVERYSLKTPLRRMGTPRDISPVVSFLLSDSASYITGQNIVIDGGWTVV